jgi:hypothetical protein
MGDFVGDHLDRIKEAYSTTSQHFRTYFIALSVFTLFFLSAIFIPYVNNSTDRHELNQAISTGIETIGRIQEIVDIYGLAQNESRQVDLDLNTTQGDIKNVSLTLSSARQFTNMPIDVSNTIGSSIDPQIASFGENVYLVWREKNFKNDQVLFRNPSNYTNVTRVLGNVSGTVVYPQVAASGENVYVVWASLTQGNNDIFFIKSTDRGKTFGNLTDLSSNQGTSAEVQIAVNGENIYIVWSDDTTGNNEIYYSRSTNNGSSFSEPSNLSNDRGSSTEPQLSSYGNNVYVIWNDRRAQTDNVLFKRSLDNGANFMTIGNPLNPNINTGRSRELDIVAFEDNIYVVWNRVLTDDIYFSSSKNNGTTFSGPKVVSLGIPSLSPEIALSRNYVYIVWEGRPGGTNSEIYLIRSANNGTSFEPGVENLSKNGGTSADPKIASFGEDVYVIWRDSSQGIPVNTVARDSAGEGRVANNLTTEFILFTGSQDNGRRGSFTDHQTNISPDIGSIHSPPLISVSANNIYVAWISNPSGNEEVYLNLDKSGLQEMVLDQFSNYRQMLRETIFEPFQTIDKAIKDDIIKNLAIPIDILENLQTDTKNLLNEAEILDSELRGLSNTVVVKSENNTLLRNISQPENPPRAAAITAVPSPSPSVVLVANANVEDEIQRKIIEIKGRISVLTKNLIDQQTTLTNQLNISQEKLDEVNTNLEEISKRLETIETPLGPLPVELKDSIPIFPILVAAGLLICLHLLKESICLRKSFHILYHRKHAGELSSMVRPQQTSLIAPLWIDPLDSNLKKIVWFIILLIPLLVYLYSIAVIWSTGTLLIDNSYYGWAYTITYLGLLIVVIWFYWIVLAEIRTYEDDVDAGIYQSNMPKCGKPG